jgi:hypothetical protein
MSNIMFLDPSTTVNIEESIDKQIGLNGKSKFYQINSSTHSLASSISVCTDKFGFMDSSMSLSTIGRESKLNLTQLRRREKKWIKMTSSTQAWNLYFTKHHKTLSSRVRKGIPPSIRPKAWFYLCSAVSLQKDQNTFEGLCKQEGNKKYLHDIEKDLHRNFPTHELFGGEFGHIGKAELFRILKAYSIHNPVVGYCQAQAPIAALLLMNMPSDKAFWCLQQICDHILKGYYSEGMTSIQVDGNTLFLLCKAFCPDTYNHLKNQDIQPMFFMQEWFLCVYTRTFPMSTVLRVWDMFMCEGNSILFKVGLIVLKHTLTKDVRKQCLSDIDTLSVLKDLPTYVTNEKFMVKKVIDINIKNEDITKERAIQLRKFNNENKR